MSWILRWTYLSTSFSITFLYLISSLFGCAGINRCCYNIHFFFLYFFIRAIYIIEAVHKKRPQSWRRGLSSADILRPRGEFFSDENDRNFWCKKFWIFLNLWGVSAWTREEGRVWASADILRIRGVGSIFRYFVVRTFFTVGPIWIWGSILLKN